MVVMPPNPSNDNFQAWNCVKGSSNLPSRMEFMDFKTFHVHFQSQYMQEVFITIVQFIVLKWTFNSNL
jgi:hypothetical protein